MKIIVENEQEKQELLRASKYLHDFLVYKKGKKVFINDKKIDDGLYCLDMDNDIIGLLCHLYTIQDDCDIISVNNK